MWVHRRYPLEMCSILRVANLIINRPRVSFVIEINRSPQMCTTQHQHVRDHDEPNLSLTSYNWQNRRSADAANTLALGVFQAEHLGLVLISEDFRVATPIDHSVECFFGGAVA
jgi:hypothetical protein